ncbi:MAG: hypothetical protein M3R55_17855 [Acidobacteriota bacterium]|nr:hypothetical protein [Acidobacteriota bacterium]
MRLFVDERSHGRDERAAQRANGAPEPRAGRFATRTPLLLFAAVGGGEVFVVRAGRTYELLASNTIGEILMATPAAVGNLLIVRSQHHLIGLRQG